jgi:hypothetical protein
MTREEWDARFDAIIKCDGCVCYETKKQIKDDDGIQYVLSETRYESPVGTIKRVYEYVGGSRDWRMVGMATQLVIDGVTYDEPVVVPQE